MDFSLTRSAAFIIIIGILLLMLIETTTAALALSLSLYYLLYWAALSSLFILLAVLPWAEGRYNDTIIITKAFLVGLIVGGVMAILKLSLYQELWTIFNLAAEPLRTGLFGSLLINLSLRLRTVSAY